jgi:hypothetical protein
MRSFLPALLAFTTSALFAADPVKLTLEDFTDGSGAKPAAGWSTEEGGVIQLTPTKGTSFLISKKEYSSFVLEWDWKLADAGNNGIKYWVTNIKDAKGKGEWLGVEYQMIDDNKHPDGLKGGSHNTGSIYDLFDSAKEKILKPIGEWNHSRVVIKDGKIEHFLNGKPVSSADTTSAEWKEHVTKSKFSKKKDFAPGHGKLMLTEHGDPCWFKNLVITEL